MPVANLRGPSCGPTLLRAGLESSPTVRDSGPGVTHGEPCRSAAAAHTAAAVAGLRSDRTPTHRAGTVPSSDSTTVRSDRYGTVTQSDHRLIR
eukprot:765009-Hanusia_phi.AAC.2